MIFWVLWYSIVPFQCRIRWKCIFASRGVPSFLAIFLRWYAKPIPKWRLEVVKILSDFFVSRCSIPTSFGDILKILGRLFFSGVLSVNVFASGFRELQVSREHSPILMPVSLSV